MTGRALIVPIRVDVLSVTSATVTAGPLADFSVLPFHDGRRDVNPGTPYVAPVQGDTPFEEAAVRLPTGLHLHWTLPVALTRGEHRPDGVTPATERTVLGLDFPCVPNRWLVVASRSKTDTDVQRWVVESDYVHPEGSDAGAVTYLLPPHERTRLGGHAPFRRVGRQVPLEGWRPDDPSAHHLDGLTAVGWGHPLFHAYHPSCSSVFGFHLAFSADDVPAEDTFSFQVFGWYADPGQDPVSALAAAHPGEPLAALLEARYGWRSDPDLAPPDRLLCYGVRYDGQVLDADTDGGLDRVVLGATGAAALAADLAVVHHGNAAALLPPSHMTDSRELYEEVVEAIGLGTQVDPERPDALAALRDARHDQEFVAVPGGRRWTIRARGPGGAADALAAPSAVPGAVPAAAVARLHDLDGLQQRRDRLDRQSATLRERLFAEWCAYLECKYPPRGSRLDRPDVDELRRHIEVHSLAVLEAGSAESAAIALLLDAETSALVADLADADTAACAIRAADVLDWAAVAAALPQSVAVAPADETAVATALRSLNALVADPNPPPGTGPDQLAALAPWLRDADEPAALAAERAATSLWPGDPVAAVRWRDAGVAHAATVRRAQRNRALLEQALPGALAVATKARHELDQRPGPRFWRPRDPVVVLDGPAVAGGPRHRSRTAHVGCGNAAVGVDVVVAVVAVLDNPAVDPEKHPEQLAAQLFSVGLVELLDDPVVNWHPLLLDWKIVFHDEAAEGERDPLDDRAHYRYAPDHVLRRYRLPAGEPDVVATDPRDLTGRRRVSVVSGRSLLSHHPTDALREALAAGPPPPDKPVTFADQVRTDAADAVRTDPEGVTHLASTTALPIMAASLSGLHDALLMREPAFPIGIDDPLGFGEARAFAARVAVAVGGHSTASPRPLMPFMPLRAGRLQLVDLQVVDSFGQVRGGLLGAATVSASGAMPASRVVPVQGPPVPVFSAALRLLQPARLRMRWLAAASPADESHDHPSTGPVCGWLVPDVLDDALMVHGPDGAAIGSVDGPGRWRPAPGSDRFVPPGDIADPGLRRVVVHLLHQAPDERARLMRVLIAGLDGVEPDSHAQHTALGLLVGRPVAVVRASVRLEFLGLPPVDHGWPALRDMLAGHPRSDAGLRAVRFPLRLGEPGRLDDGLLGFWTENGDDLDGRMRAPHGVANEGDPAPLVLCADAPTTTLTMLMDPRATVHATTGVLPTKVLRIPPEQYGPALHAIGVTFPVTALLTDPDTLRVALPVEPGHVWSWLERTDDGWHELSAPAAPRADAALTAPQVLRDGWLRLAPDPAWEPA